jgi:Flp pilus assembly pilin Flp
MNRLAETAKAFLYREDGPTTVEYAVMLGIIVFAVFATLSVFGERVWGIYSAINGDMPV